MMCLHLIYVYITVLNFLCCQNKQKTQKKILCNAYADGIALGIGLSMCQMAGPMPTALPSA